MYLNMPVMRIMLKKSDKSLVKHTLFICCDDYGTVSTDNSSISLSTNEGIGGPQIMSLESATVSLAHNTTLRNVNNPIYCNIVLLYS
jgi:hypothetical protein